MAVMTLLDWETAQKEAAQPAGGREGNVRHSQRSEIMECVAPAGLHAVEPRTDWRTFRRQPVSSTAGR